MAPDDLGGIAWLQKKKKNGSHFGKFGVTFPANPQRRKVNRIVPSFPQHSKITIMARKPRLTPAQRRQLIKFILERKVNGKVLLEHLKMLKIILILPTIL